MPGRHRPAADHWPVGTFLGGLALVLIPLGNTIVQIGPYRVAVAYALAPVALLAAVLVMTVVTRRSRVQVPLVVWGAVVSSVLMGIPWAMQENRSPAVFPWLLFAAGTIGGALVGMAWPVNSRRLNAVDLGLLAFVGTTVVTLAKIALGTDSLNRYHQAVVLAWGGSNYVAGVLIVASLALLARRAVFGAWIGSVVTVALLAAVLTLSRGALLAASLGVMTFCWTLRGKTRRQMILYKVLGVAVLVGTQLAFRAVTAVRSIGGYDPGVNVTARWVLIDDAWNQFLSSPLVGTGWLHLRNTNSLGHPLSFAHNLVLSFLQIGGLFGLIFLICLAASWIRCWLRVRELRPALVAALVISLSDPFFESVVAALVSWLVICAHPGSAAPSATAVLAEHLATGRRLCRRVIRRGNLARR